MADNSAPAPLGEGISDEELASDLRADAELIQARTFTNGDTDPMWHVGERMLMAAHRLSSGRDRNAVIEDAERWRALMASERIRVMGSAGFKNVGGEWVPGRDDLHIGVEFWSLHEARHPSAEFPQESSRQLFVRYVDHIRAALKTPNGDKP